MTYACIAKGRDKRLSPLLTYPPPFSQATTPVAVLLASWAMGVSQPNLKVFLNVMVIVFGVVLASLGEIRFVMIGFLYQLGGIVFEALRLTMVQRLLSSADFKMDPLVSLYYFAPVCATMNLVVALLWEVPKVTMEDFNNVGYPLFFLNGLCAFLLNVSVVFLVRNRIPPRLSQNTANTYSQHSNYVTDWQDLRPGPDPLRCPQGHPARRRLDAHLGHPRHGPPVLRLRHCAVRHGLLQAGLRNPQELRC